jgi:tetratricopeptide (TPR) repeat protein
MRFGVESDKLFFLFLLISFLFLNACGQSKTEKAKLHNEYAKRASELRRNGDLQEAIKEQEKAVSLLPENGKPLTVLAGMYLDLYEQDASKINLEKAREILKKSTELDPKDAIGHKMYSETLERLGDKQGAIKELEIAVEMQPENLDNLVNLGVIQQSVKDNKSATESFEKVLLQNPNYIYALYQYGEAELENKNIEKAKELFGKAIKSSSQSGNTDSRYIELSRKRLEELNNRKSQTAKP